ncbi:MULTISPECIES: hypothetical protein [unclassified Streptomyces]|uniref:hypothetical protein n=1 Tax=unclassified Streptomyces TaxID=2593676 RepID=UPI00336A6EFB
MPAFARPAHSFYGFAEWYWFYQQVAPEELRRVIQGFVAESGHPHLEHHRREFGEDVTYDDLIDRWRTEAGSQGVDRVTGSTRPAARAGRTERTSPVRLRFQPPKRPEAAGVGCFYPQLLDVRDTDHPRLLAELR